MEDNDLRVIVIGLDGATWDLIKPWAYEGKLPTFKEIMDSSEKNTRSAFPSGHVMMAVIILLFLRDNG